MITATDKNKIKELKQDPELKPYHSYLDPVELKTMPDTPDALKDSLQEWTDENSEDSRFYEFILELTNNIVTMNDEVGSTLNDYYSTPKDILKKIQAKGLAGLKKDRAKLLSSLEENLEMEEEGNDTESVKAALDFMMGILDEDPAMAAYYALSRYHVWLGFVVMDYAPRSRMVDLENYLKLHLYGKLWKEYAAG